MKIFCVSLLIAGGLLLNAARPVESVPDLASERAALLAQHESARLAHFDRDVEKLMSGIAPELLYVRDGKITRRTKEQGRAQFTEYFRSAEFSMWDDLEPPVVQVSPDGKIAWMLCRVKVKYVRTSPDGTKTPTEFVCAWLATYEKQGNRWLMTANASTFQPR
jgi:ketosteroid isomerase-like protein